MIRVENFLVYFKEKVFSCTFELYVYFIVRIIYYSLIILRNWENFVGLIYLR